MGMPEDADLAAAIAKLRDPEYRLFSGELYKIIIKDENDPEAEGLILPFQPNRAQRRFISRLHHRNIILKARQLGFCLDPSTRVLTADLRWVPIKDLKAGDEVVSVDEFPPGGRGKGRRMRTATVQAAVEVFRKAYRITFDDGRSVVCTGQHPWLSRNSKKDPVWRSIDNTGNNTKGYLTVGTQVRWITKPWDESTFEDGWFGGMLDGEGSMSKSNSSAGINVSQRVGEIWDRLVKYVDDRGYKYCIESDQPERLSKYGKVPVPKVCIGRMDEMFRLIGQTRPTRFLSRRFWEGREMPGKRNGDVGWSTIVSIEPLEDQVMIDLQTTTGTYIAEGFVSHNTTLVAILWLDFALFNSNVRCGIICQDDLTAQTIFRDKVKFAYDNLPEGLRAAMPLKYDNLHEMLFKHNNSSIRVASSMRGGTIHRLHISEFGKICAQNPGKAAEVISGSIPTVPISGILIIESTAEGQQGSFYDMTQAAIKRIGKSLTPKEYRFHFYAWWEDEQYRMDPTHVLMTDKDHEYFDIIEAQMRTKLDMEQRAWYVATRTEMEDAGKGEKMLQEYPSTPSEAFQKSIEGTFYAKEMARVRKDKRICNIPVLDIPCFTFWDIGGTAGTAIWVMQRLGLEIRLIDYYEEHGETYAHAYKWLMGKDYIWAKHFLPHDAAHQRQLSDVNKSPEDMLNELGLKNTEIVPRIENLDVGIDLMKKRFPSLWFDEVRCDQGIKRLDGYKRKWDNKQGTWRPEPEKMDGNSEGADALRQLAQAEELGMITLPGLNKPKARKGNWRTA